MRQKKRKREGGGKREKKEQRDEPYSNRQIDDNLIVCVS